MKKTLFAFIITTSTFIQNINAQEITLEKLYSGYYYASSVEGISSLNDGEHFTTLEPDGIAKFNYKNFQKLENLVDGKFEAYSLAPDESKILLQREKQSVYRHSFLGKYDVKDFKSNKTIPLNNGNWIQEPKFSPDGNKVAFIADNNLYYQDLTSNKITQITKDGKKNAIINGLGDWVYEEEFGHADYYQWNKAGDAIVYVKFDESNVREVFIPIYGKSLYPTEMRYKYPKAGETNSTVSAELYQLSSGKTTTLNIAQFENYYIPKIWQTNDSNEIVIATSNRHHNKVDLIKINTQSGNLSKLLTETDNAWIETDNLTLEFLDDNSFLWASERDGYRHLYWYDQSGQLKKQVSKGPWEITDYYGYNPKTKEAYIQTTEKGSLDRVVSKLDINSGKTSIISNKEGKNSADFSKNFNYFINTISTAKSPSRYVLKDASGNEIKELHNNDAILTRLKNDNFVDKEFFTIPNSVGDPMNAWIIKPKNFEPKKKYPLFMYQYSGPGSQQVSNSWDQGNSIWFEMLAQKGYIVACVDGRGTGYKGSKFKKAIYKQLGKFEIEDQITAAKWFGNQSYIDKTRIGIFGWSFGGYMSSLALTKGADVFKLGIAVAPVTNWRYYDTIYTERFLQTPQENPEGYDQNSPTTFAHLLKGKFLLIHGTADDNVHFQNSMEFSEALIQNKKQFDIMAYPDKDHGIYGGQTRHQLYEKMTQFILQNL